MCRPYYNDSPPAKCYIRTRLMQAQAHTRLTSTTKSQTRHNMSAIGYKIKFVLLITHAVSRLYRDSKEKWEIWERVGILRRSRNLHGQYGARAVSMRYDYNRLGGAIAIDLGRGRLGHTKLPDNSRADAGWTTLQAKTTMIASPASPLPFPLTGRQQHRALTVKGLRVVE
jgi:hypothetical protein